MCGIVGMITRRDGGFDKDDQDAFLQMLYCDALRGADGTGAFGVSKWGNASWIKRQGHPLFLASSDEWKNFNDKIWSKFRMVFGHNRKATIANNISSETSHPFVSDNIVMIHNGFIKNDKELTDKQISVDSEAVLHSLEERGPLETLSMIEGAYSLVWYNVKEKKLYIARNNERPLWLIDSANCWYIASEDDMATWIMKRNTIKGIKDSAFFAPGKLYSFDLDNLSTYSLEDIPTKKSKPPVWGLPLPPSSSLGMMPHAVHQTATSTGKRGSGRGLSANQDFIDLTTSIDNKDFVSIINKEDIKSRLFQLTSKSIPPITSQFHKNLAIDKTIGFLLEDILYIPTEKQIVNPDSTQDGWIVGRWVMNQDVRIKAPFTWDMDYDQLLESDYLEGQIVACSFGGPQGTVALLKDVSGFNVDLTVNKVPMYPDVWDAIPHNCTKCGSPVAWSEVGDSSVVLKKVVAPGDTIKYESRLICVDCIVQALDRKAKSC